MVNKLNSQVQEDAQAEVSMCTRQQHMTPPLCEEGAQPSNTAPANYTDPLILRTGIDSLYLSYGGELRSEHETRLEACKASAQSSNAEDQKDATVLLSNQSFAVSGRGTNRFAYILSHNWYQLQVSRARAGRLPLAYVQVRSEVLTLAPLDDLVRALNLVVEDLGGKVVHPLVSRVDLCLDMVTSTDLGSLKKRQWVARAKKRAEYHDGQRLSGYVFGQGGPVSCRIYDKTLEIQTSGKEYLYPLWKEQGWDGEANVWRVEFQLRGEALREMGIRSLEDLKRNLNSIWGYCSGEWLRLCIPSKGANQTRWALHPLWKAISQVNFNLTPATKLWRVSRITSPSDQRLFVHGLGALTSFMAREGIDRLEEALPRYIEAASDFHRRYSRITGKTLTTYVREKVQQKRTKFSARSQADYDRKTRKLKGDL